MASCAIENDIPYPIIESSIESMVVEGQRGAESTDFADAVIDKKARTVMLYVNDSVDISNLKITRLKVTADAELLPDSAACKDYDKFPRTGFASLDSIPLSSNTRMNSPPMILRFCSGSVTPSKSLKNLSLASTPITFRPRHS